MKYLSASNLLALGAFAMSAACGSDDTSSNQTTGTASTTTGSPSTTASQTNGDSNLASSTTPGPLGTTTATATSTAASGTTSATAATTGSSTGAGTSTTGAGGSGGSGGSGGASTTGGSTGGGGGSGGSGGGNGSWTCPAGLSGAPTLGTPTRVASVPPADSFNMNNGSWGNVEGPVWIDDALYMSEMSSAPYSQSSPDQKQSRILKLAADGTVSVFVADSGSNGLAISSSGDLLAGVHKDGSVTQFSLPGGTPTVVASGYMGSPFNAPNDLAVHSSGTIYVSDPTFNAPSPPPQAQTYVYRVTVGGQVEPIPSAASPDVFTNPNGVTLSLAEDYLYVAAASGRRYPVMGTGEVGPGQDFPATNGGDGMVVDCAGNLYVTKANSSNVEVYTPDGASIGTITVPGFQGVTNVAFGGSDHKTLYITGLGNDKGLFQLELDIPGRPY